MLGELYGSGRLIMEPGEWRARYAVVASLQLFCYAHMEHLSQLVSADVVLTSRLTFPEGSILCLGALCSDCAATIDGTYQVIHGEPENGEFTAGQRAVLEPAAGIERELLDRFAVPRARFPEGWMLKGAA